MTTQRLVDHPAVLDARSAPAITGSEKQFRPNGLLLLGFIVMFIGVAFGVIGKMLIHQDAVTVVGVLASLAGMFMVAYSSLFPSQPQKYNSNRSPKPVLTEVETPKSLSSQSNTDYAPSITERTTDLLEIPVGTTQSHKHDRHSQPATPLDPTPE
jgi:predicted lipid-binding transport protein (Tim44 family)